MSHEYNFNALFRSLANIVNNEALIGSGLNAHILVLAENLSGRE